MREKLSKAAQLKPGDWLTLLRASVWLLLTDLTLRTLGLARTQALLIPRKVIPSGESPLLRNLPPEWLCYLVSVAAEHHLYAMNCLPRSLVLQRLLAQRGTASELRIGVRREEERLLAHAWLEVEGRPLCEARDVEARFLPLVAHGG